MPNCSVDKVINSSMIILCSLCGNFCFTSLTFCASISSSYTMYINIYVFLKISCIICNLDSQLYNTRKIYVDNTNPEDKDLHVKASTCLCTFLLVPGSTFYLTGYTSFLLSTPKVLFLSEIKG